MDFHDWIKEHARGELDRQLSEAVNEVAGAVALLDKTGKVTLELSFSKTGGRIMVSGQVKAKAPAGDAEAGIYFLGADGLTKDDPMQMRFDDVHQPFIEDDAPPRIVDTDTGEVIG